jgi:integrase/recombinase XerD
MPSHPGFKVRRGNSWRVVIYIGTTRHQFGPREWPELRGAAEADVEEFARARHAELVKQADREAVGLPGPMAFSRLLAEFDRDQLPRLSANTRRTYATALANFRAFFVDRLKDIRADRVRSPHVRKYLTWREQRDSVGARTLAKDRATLHALFNYALRELEVVDANPVSNVKPPKVDGRTPIILTPVQVDGLVAACEGRPMLRLWIMLLADTGLRCDSEACWLRWEDLDLERGRIVVVSGRGGHRTKGGKGRVVPMTPRLKQAIAAHRLAYAGRDYHGERSPWVFHHETDRRKATAGQRVRTFRRGFENAVKRAALPAELHVHDLRHIRITSWLARGASPVHVKEAAGHSDLRTTMGYAHLAEEHVAALAALDSPAPPTPAAKSS